MMKQEKNIYLKYIISFLAIVLLLPTLSYGQEGKQKVIDKIIAKVDNNIILLSDIEYMYLDMSSRGEVHSKCQILQQLVTSKMLLAVAVLDSVDVLEIEVKLQLERRMDYFIAQSGGSAEALEEYYGKGLEEMQEEMREGMRDQMVAQKMKDQISAHISITPKEVKHFFNRIPKDSLPYFSEEVEVSQIVKVAKISEEHKEKVEQTLLKLKSQIEGGEDFGKLAKEYSMDPGSAKMGGELFGWHKRGELAPEYEAACFKMDVGDISQPVKSDFGFHLIQLLERRGNEFRSRHILIIPPSSDLDIKQAKHELDSIRTLIKEEKMSFERAAKTLSDDKMSAPSGGFFLDNLGAKRISVDQLAPDIFFILDTMKVGSISSPISFKMQDGKEAVRIVYYKNRFEPHQADLIVDWQKIYQATLNEKKSKAEQQWAIESVEKVYIYIDDEFKHCDILGK